MQKQIDYIKRSSFRNLLIAVSAIAFFFSCGVKKGHFAYKYLLDDAYRRIDGKMNFPQDEHVQWIYSFQGTPLKTKIGVIQLKKELVWVENYAKSDYVDISKKVIYGTIEEMPRGLYRIVLTNVASGKKIDEFDFEIYRDEEESDYELD